MTQGRPGYSDRKMNSRWAIFENGPAIDPILACRGLSPSAGNSVIGYIYVDHEEGISLRIHTLCRVEPGKPPRIVANFEDHGEGCILRYDEFGVFRLLSNNEMGTIPLADHERYYLFEDQRWFIYYDHEKVHEVRERTDLDRFRAHGFFDDVFVVLSREDAEHVPEVVWVRLEEVTEGGAAFGGVLLNEPDGDLGVHEGDSVIVRVAKHPEGRCLVALSRPA